jgi:alpha-galactosidase
MGPFLFLARLSQTTIHLSPRAVGLSGAMASPNFIALHGTECSAIWEIAADEAPVWRYWGTRVPDGALPNGPIRDARPAASFSLDSDLPLSLFPGAGLGWFGQSALLAHREGRDWAQQIGDCRVERPDDATVRFVLSDALAGISAVITARLDPISNVLSLSTRLENSGDALLDVHWLAAGNLPLPPVAQAVRSWSGRHNQEFVPVDSQLDRSLWRRENRRGLTSHDCFPGAVVTAADGIAYGAQLAWSGNHVQQIEWLDDGRFHWQMGEWLAPGEVRLAPGEAIETPEMLATCSAEGSNGVAWNFHRHVRSLVSWPGGAMKPRPVHLNSWEGFYFDHDLAEMKALATAAAEIGVERFVLDDGWFHRRDDDSSSLGDWWVDDRKYPDGLEPLAEHVTGLGMEFGLWVEPEMLNPDSELFRAHPDWALQIAGRDLVTGRNQLVLDMANPAVGDYLFDAIAKLLSTLPISYLKWDHNRDLTHAGATPRYRRQVLASYALMQRLREAFPDVEIEACAGGGGRIDAGIARYVHRYWASDNIDALSRVGIQRGFLQFLPPEMMGSHVGASPAHSTGRSMAMPFRCGVAQSGHFGIELDVRKLEGEDRAKLAEGIAAYKATRDLVHHGRTWLGEGADGLVWEAHGSEDDLVLSLVQTTPPTLRFPAPVPVPMLDQARHYRVTLEGGAPHIVHGAWLAASGLTPPRLRAEQIAIYRLTAV